MAIVDMAEEDELTPFLDYSIQEVRLIHELPPRSCKAGYRRMVHQDDAKEPLLPGILEHIPKAFQLACTNGTHCQMGRTGKGGADREEGRTASSEVDGKEAGQGRLLGSKPEIRQPPWQIEPASQGPFHVEPALFYIEIVVSRDHRYLSISGKPLKEALGHPKLRHPAKMGQIPGDTDLIRGLQRYPFRNPCQKRMIHQAAALPVPVEDAEQALCEKLGQREPFQRKEVDI